MCLCVYVFEMEKEQNATVHGLVLEVSPAEQSRNNNDVKEKISARMILKLQDK